MRKNNLCRRKRPTVVISCRQKCGSIHKSAVQRLNTSPRVGRKVEAKRSCSRHNTVGKLLSYRIGYSPKPRELRWRVAIHIVADHLVADHFVAAI